MPRFSFPTHVRLAWWTVALLTIISNIVPAQAQELTPTSTPTAQWLTEPDRCEPNDTLVAPCALQTEIEHTNLNVIDGSSDVFSFLLKANRVYTISATSRDGIDPVLRVMRASEPNKVVAENDDAAAGSANASVQIAVTEDALYLVEVTNRAPGAMAGKTYAVTTRSSAVPATTPAPHDETNTTDQLENNYDVPHATPIAWGVPYDLSLTCPDPRPDACFAGDHDFLLVPVKHGIPLIAMSYDLGPGADTVLTLYKPDPTQTSQLPGQVPGWTPLISNDDVVPGRTLRSQVMFTPDWDGDALLIVAESNRRNPPTLPAALGPTGRYRLMVGSPAMEALQAVLNAQTDLQPTGTPAPTSVPPSVYEQNSAGRVQTPPAPTAIPSAPTPAPQSVAAPDPGTGGDAEEIIKESCTVGTAVVQRETADFYAAANPTSERRLLTTYPHGTQVTLLGSCYIGWVKVQPHDAVTPGWMFAPDLRLLEGGPAAPEPTAAGGASISQLRRDTSAPKSASTTVQPTSASLPPIEVRSIAAPVPTAQPPLQRQTLTISVSVTDAEQRPFAGIRTMLTDAFGRVLIDVVTPDNGQLRLTPDLLPGSVVYVVVPSVGAQIPVDPSNPIIGITLPRGAE